MNVYSFNNKHKFKGGYDMQRLKEDIRRRIIEIGIQRFKKEGYDKTLMKDIASDVGISTGNIYRYFLTKGHLLDEILGKLESQIENYFDNLSTEFEKIDFYQDYNNVVDLTVSIAENNNDVLRVMFKSQSEKQFIKFRDRILNMFIGKIKIIASSIKKDDIDEVICESIARSLFEGFTYITKENIDDIDKLRTNLELYGKLMLKDIKERM